MLLEECGSSGRFGEGGGDGPDAVRERGVLGGLGERRDVEPEGAGRDRDMK